MNHYPRTALNVSEHFNTKGDTLQDFSFMPIDKGKHYWKILKEMS
jgi:hypothetical protein